MNTQALEQALGFIRSWLAIRFEIDEIPGFAVAIAHDGNLVLNDVYGFADVERQAALTTDHLFRIASHSKTFTATALMLLAEEGRLRLDDTAADHLPWLRAHKDPRWHAVTLRQLMSHGAGVIRDGEDATYWQLERPFPDAASFQSELLTTDLVTDANVKLKYSNYGYTLLGLVIEAVAARPYNAFVAERIVGPLGLLRTAPEYDPALGDSLVTGYGQRIHHRRRPLPPVSTQAMSAATGFCANAADLCAYFSAHMVGSGRLLSDASKREMQRVHWHAKLPGESAHEDYGLGMVRYQIGKRSVFGHSGGFPGCITQSMADPEERLVVVALTNCVDGPASSIVTGIYKILAYFQENAPDAGAGPDLSRLGGTYASLWGMRSIVATGAKVVAVRPDAWEPFAAVETLSPVDDTALRVTDTSSFASEGELVRFDLTDGRVASVNYTGMRMWPLDLWWARNR